MKTLKLIILVLISLYVFIGFLKYNQFIRDEISYENSGVSFAVFGDVPYDKKELYLARRLIKEINSIDLSAVIHVGDSFSGPCTIDQYKESFEIFKKITHKFIFTPGDNDWSDCVYENGGSFEPLERLTILRNYILESRSKSIRSQDNFPENVIWVDSDIVFATLHLVGRENFTKFFSGRTIEHDNFNNERENANIEWVQVAFDKARDLNSSTIVILFHADPRIEKPENNSYRQKYNAVLLALEKEAKMFKGSILLIHGDTHHYKSDNPMIDRNSGKIIKNVHRIIVPGSPEVGYIYVNISDNGEISHEVKYSTYFLIALEKIKNFTNNFYELNSK
jgi:hypothetical protein